jgi:hypothetical protein
LNIVSPKVDVLKAHDIQFADLDRRIEEITVALQSFFRNQLRSISENNAAIVCNYIADLNRDQSFSKLPKKQYQYFVYIF